MIAYIGLGPATRTSVGMSSPTQISRFAGLHPGGGSTPFYFRELISLDLLKEAGVLTDHNPASFVGGMSSPTQIIDLLAHFQADQVIYFILGN